VNQVINNPPEVTVLLSCYNGACWLAEAINSVLNQTFEGFEFIIVDDGSTDTSPEIIKHFADQDARIVVIHKRNTGLADSLNVGIQSARGTWIARLDADDISEPDRLQQQLVVARNNLGLAFIGSGHHRIDESGKIVKTHRFPVTHSQLVKRLTSKRKFPAHSSAMYRTDMVRSIGGYRVRILRAQDYDLWLRLSEIGQFTTLTQPLVRFRTHSDQVSHQDSGRRQQIDSHVALVSHWLRRFGSPDPVDAAEEDFAMFRAWVADGKAQQRMFDYLDYLWQVNARLTTGTKLPFGYISAVIVALGKPQFLWQHIRALVFADLMTRRLALEWIALRRERATGSESLLLNTKSTIDANEIQDQ